MSNLTPLPPLPGIGSNGTYNAGGGYTVNGGFPGNPALNPDPTAPPGITGTGEAGLPIDTTGMGGTGFTLPTVPALPDPVSSFQTWFNTTLAPFVQNYAIEIVLVAVALIALNALFKPDISGLANNAVNNISSGDSKPAESSEAGEAAEAA